MSSDRLDSPPFSVVWTPVVGGRPNELAVQIQYNSRDLIDSIPTVIKGLLIVGNDVVLPQALIDLLLKLLDLVASLPSKEKRKKISLATAIFSHFTDPGSAVPNPTLRRMYLRAILDQVWKWEDAHEEVHKGTPYFFMGKSYYNSGDIPSSFVCFFKAVEEDKKNYPVFEWDYKTAPAYLTASLVDDRNNNVYPTIVKPTRDTLKTFIDGYNSRHRRSLSLPILDTRFLQEDTLDDKKRLFTATFEEIYQLMPLSSPRMITNDYSKLKTVDLFFNICLVIDQLLEYKFLQTIPERDRKMARGVYALALAEGWTNNSAYRDAGAYVNAVLPTLNNSRPDQTVPDILDGRAMLSSRFLFPIEAAILLSYHIRNFAGHNIEGNSVFVDRYPEVLDRVMDALFFTIEHL